MGLETADTIAELNPNFPLGTDPKSEGDDHLRLIKDVLQKDALTKTDMSIGRALNNNGQFNIWQQGSVIPSPANGAYTADHHLNGFSLTGGGGYDVSRFGTAVNGQFHRAYGLNTTIAVATPGANDYQETQVRIDGYTANRLAWGTSAALPMSITFWARAVIPGIYSCTLRNDLSDRIFTSEYEVFQSGVWEFKTILIPPDTGGTWLKNVTALSLIVSFATLSEGTAGAPPSTVWGGVFGRGSENQVNGLDTVSSPAFALTGLQIEASLTPTPFEFRTYEMDMAIAEYYFQKSFQQDVQPQQNVGSFSGSIEYRAMQSGTTAVSNGIPVRFNRRMRVSPSLTFYNPGAANANWRNVTGTVDSALAQPTHQGEMGFFAQNAQVAGDGLGNLLSVHYTADSTI